MIAVVRVTAVTGVFLRSAVVVAHSRVVVLHRRRGAVILVHGVMGVLVVLAHQNSLFDAPGVEPGADG
ncbi:hypothetical protein ASF87_07640 [Microbacterium sp. Leaf161]|nr:hypothetical protein ASF87_07640 [Microbacterium sp. Leaf161]